MITAQVSNPSFPEPFKVDHVCNRGDWFGETWLIGVGCGFSTFLVEAGCEGDAIDAFVDSKHGHTVTISREEDEERDPNYRSYAGNESTPVDLDEVRILERCKVNYFAKKGE